MRVAVVPKSVSWRVRRPRRRSTFTMGRRAVRAGHQIDREDARQESYPAHLHRLQMRVARLGCGLLRRVGVVVGIISRARLLVPVSEWVRAAVRESGPVCLNGAEVRTHKYFRRHTDQWVVVEHSTGRQNRETLLWYLFKLELWQLEYGLT